LKRIIITDTIALPFVGKADALVFCSTLACMFANYLVNFVGQFTWVKLEFLEARLRPVEQLDREVEIGCRSSGTCD
jgi:hypothetical protein